MKIKTIRQLIVLQKEKHKPTQLYSGLTMRPNLAYYLKRPWNIRGKHQHQEVQEVTLQPAGEKRANPQTHQRFHQRNHCRAYWSPGGCYCPCPQRPQSSGYCLLTPCCRRCRCSCCCHHRGSPSPEQSRLLENTGEENSEFLFTDIWKSNIFPPRHFQVPYMKKADITPDDALVCPPILFDFPILSAALRPKPIWSHERRKSLKTGHKSVV